MANWSDPRVTAAPPRPATDIGRDVGVDAGLRKHMLSVYNYMTSGVLLTGVVALLFSTWDGAPAVLFGPGPLKYLIVTPDFHHWHHSSDDVAIARNYAAHYAFLDHLFGTAIKGQTGFPEKYGVVGDYMPDGFTKQFMFPFRKQK